MNQDALMLYLSNSFRSLRVPIVPAQMPDSSQNPLLDNFAFIRLASTDIAGTVLAPIGSKPTGHCVDIHSIAVMTSASSESSNSINLASAYQTKTSFLPILMMRSW